MDLLTTLRRISPIAHVDKLRCPTLLLLGSSDLRVPMSQGIEYWRAAKTKGIADIRARIYEDCHPLGETTVASNVAVGAAEFYAEVLGEITK